MAKVGTKFTPIRASVGSTRAKSGFASATAAAQDVKSQIDAIVQNFIQWANHMDESAEGVLLEALQPTFDESQGLVPVDTGALKESGYLESRKFRGQTVAEIGYGRGGEPYYAPLVHEDLEMRHQPPTQAKFLQEPLEKNIDQIQADILSLFKEASGT